MTKKNKKATRKRTGGGKRVRGGKSKPRKVTRGIATQHSASNGVTHEMAVSAGKLAARLGRTISTKEGERPRHRSGKQYTLQQAKVAQHARTTELRRLG